MKLPKLVGVIHLPPLPGAPLSHGHHPAEALQQAGLFAVQEAQTLAKAGFDGIIIENFGDTPFYKSSVPPETISSMAIIAAAVREVVDVQVGINVLRNDGRAALSIAAVTGCDFIRVNVLSGVTATDQGLIEGEASFLIRERDRFHAPVAILADVHVKHAKSLSSDDIGVAIEDAALRALADGVIISGATTGRAVSPEILEAASQVARKNKIPLFIGSGATHDNLSEIKPWVDGIIVGSALRKGMRAGAELVEKQAREFARIYTMKKALPPAAKKKALPVKKRR